MKLDPYFFHESKSSEDQKKRSSQQIEEFLFPKTYEDQNKKFFSENWRVFVPEIKWRPTKTAKIIQRSDADQSQIIGGLLG